MVGDGVGLSGCPTRDTGGDKALEGKLAPALDCEKLVTCLVLFDNRKSFCILNIMYIGSHANYPSVPSLPKALGFHRSLTGIAIQPPVRSCR